MPVALAGVFTHTKSMQFVDTHCHIHDPEFFTAEQAEEALEQAVKAGVTRMICVGTSLEDSRRAVAFADAHPENCWASIGIHPHEGSKLTPNEITRHLEELSILAEHPSVIAVGECGLDFYYNDKNDYLTAQEALLRGQIEIALNYTLPITFHVREAFDEFWRIFEGYKGIKGVLHSFTDRSVHLERALVHQLLIGINGIATFTTHKWQLDLFKTVKLADFVLETDAPFLTPKPIRGNMNAPENVIYITKFLADLRNESEEVIAKATTANAKKLFNLV